MVSGSISGYRPPVWALSVGLARRVIIDLEPSVFREEKKTHDKKQNIKDRNKKCDVATLPQGVSRDMLIGTLHRWGTSTHTTTNSMEATIVIGPDLEQSAHSELSNKIPSRLDGHGDYRLYREDVTLCTNQTTRPTNKHWIAAIGPLYGKARTTAKTLEARDICSHRGVKLILKRLDKAYAIDKSNQLDADRTDALDYSWKMDWVLKISSQTSTLVCTILHPQIWIIN